MPHQEPTKERKSASDFLQGSAIEQQQPVTKKQVIVGKQNANSFLKLESTNDEGFWSRLFDTAEALGEGANIGIISFLGIPGNVVQSILEAPEKEPIELPGKFNFPTLDTKSRTALAKHPALPTSENLEKAFNFLGFGTTPDQDSALTRIAGRTGIEVGAAATAIVSGGASLATRGFTQSKSFVGKFLTEPLRTAPVRTGIIEGVTSTSAGVGAGLVGEATQESSDRVKIVADILGQFFFGMAASVPFSNVPTPTKIMVKMFKDVTEQLKPAGVKAQARRTIEMAISDPELALQRLQNPNVPDIEGFRPTSAQITRDPGLMSLELAEASRRPSEFGLKKSEQNTAIRNALNKVKNTEILKSVGPESTTKFFDKQVTKTRETIRTFVTDAKQKAQKSIDTLVERIEGRNPQELQIEKSQIVSTTLEDAMRLGRDQEKVLWGKIGVENVDSTLIKEVAQNIQNGPTNVRRAAGRDDIPEVIDQFILAVDDDGVSLFKNQDSIEEVLDLRTLILEKIRQEKGTTPFNANKIRLLNQLHGSVMDTLQDSARFFEDITQIPGIKQADVQIAFDNARTFSKEFNETFRQGAIGEILGTSASGAPKVVSEATLERFLSPGGLGSAKQAEISGLEDFLINNIDPDELIKNLGGSNVVSKAMKNFVVADFLKTATNPDGTLNTTVARAWVKRRDSVLGHYGDERKIITDAITKAESSKTAQVIGKRALKKVVKSRANFWLGRDPDKAMAQLLGRKDRIQITDALVKSAKKDPSGEALQGLKAAFWNQFTKFDSAQLDLFDTPFLNPVGMKKFMDGNKDVMASLGFSKQHIKNIEGAVEGARLIQLTRSPQAVVAGGSPTIEKIFTLPQLLGRAYNVQKGMVSEEFVIMEFATRARIKFVDAMTRDQIIELLDDSLFNPEIMEELLTAITPRTQKRIRQNLAAWTVNIATKGGELQDASSERPERTGGKAAILGK